MSHSRRRGSTLAIAAGIAAAVMVVPLAPASAAPLGSTYVASIDEDSMGTERDLGTVLKDPITAPAQAQGVDADGVPQAYWVTSGKGAVPAMFQVTDVRTGEVVFSERVSSGLESYAIVFSAPEMAVYLAMTDGTAYKWNLDSDHLIQLPALDEADPALAGAAIWSMAVADDGTVYAGTDSGAHLLSYDPSADAFTDLGEPVPGETVIRSMAVDDDFVYVGTSSHGNLAKVDRDSGSAELIPIGFSRARGIMSMTLAGGDLFMRVRPYNALRVYDTKADAFVGTFSNYSGSTSGLDPSGKFVYYMDTTQGIMELDLATMTPRAMGNTPSAVPESWAFVQMPGDYLAGWSLSFTYSKGRNYVINLADNTRGVTWTTDRLIGTASTITGLAADTSGRIVIGGPTGSSGIGLFDTLSGRQTVLADLGAADEIEVNGHQVVYADAATGSFRIVDPDQPIDSGNPTPPFDLGDYQSVPLDILALDDDTVAIATAPSPGQTSGALTFWNTASGSGTVYRGIVGVRSVVSLATWGDYVIAGSSIVNGAGTDAVETSAVLFTVDRNTHEVVDQLVPVNGAAVVAAVTVGEDGNVWALADGHLVHATVDADGTLALVREEALVDTVSSDYGQNRGIVLDDDRLWAVSGGALWAVDLASWEAQKVADDQIRHLEMGLDGNLYFTRGSHLYQWKLPGTVEVTPPSQIPPFTGEQVAWQAESLGMPIDQVNAIGGTALTESDGTSVIYSVTNGHPSYLNKIDAGTGKLIWAKPLPGAGGSYAVVHDDKNDIYVASVSSHGEFFRVRSGEDTVEELGIPVPGETFLWDLALGDNGMIYGSSFPGAKLWSYDTATGTVRDYGAVTDNAIQGRAVAYADGTAYVGVMTPARLIAVDVETGTKTPIPLPASVEPDNPLSGVFDVDIAGGQLYVRAGTNLKTSLLVTYDLASGTWLDRSVPRVAGLGLPAPDPNPDTAGLLYVMQDGTLTSIDPADGALAQTSLHYPGTAANYRGFGWVQLNDPEWPGQTLTGLFMGGEMWRYNPVTGRSSIQARADVEVKGSYATIMALEPAARGGLWAGGYQAGYAHIDLDSDTGKADAIQNYHFSQTESIVDDGTALWVGTYPGSRVSMGSNRFIDSSLTSAWTMVDAPGDPQNRLPGLAVTDRWVVGATVPKLTSFGGSLGIIDRATCGSLMFDGLQEVSSRNCEYTKVDDVSPDRGFTSVEIVGNIAYTGSWILGGTGSVNPPQSEGQVTAYDLERGEVLWSTSPVKGIRSYIAATMDREGQLWALGETSVVELDPATGATLRVITLPGSVSIVTRSSPNIIGDMKLVPGTDRLLVKVAGSLYEVSTDTGAVTNLGPFAYRAIAVSDTGLVFMSDGSEILKWRLPDTDGQSFLLSDIVGGDTVHVNLEGFQSNEDVEIRMAPSDDAIARLTVDSSGSTGARVTLPAAPEGGNYQLTAVGLDSGFRVSASIDATAPTTTATADPEAPESGWYRSEVAVSLTAVDDEGGTGVASTEYSFDGENWLEYTDPVVVGADGEHELFYRSTDRNLNVEETRSVMIDIDSRAPTTRAQVSDDVPASVTLTAVDPVSGVAVTTYRIDGGQWEEYVSAFTIKGSRADQTVEFRSTDAAGNVEDIGSVVITPAVPQSKDQCKDGGFAVFGFSNQGRCVATVQADGNADK